MMEQELKDKIQQLCENSWNQGWNAAIEEMAKMFGLLPAILFEKLGKGEIKP